MDRLAIVSALCDPADERPLCTKPHRSGPWLFGTNGWGLVAVPFDGQGDVPEGPSTVMEWLRIPEGATPLLLSTVEALRLASAAKTRDCVCGGEDVTCDGCSGSGRQNRRCPDCDHEHDCECGVCCGEKKIECSACDDGILEEEAGRVMLKHLPVNLAVLASIVAPLPPGEVRIYIESAHRRGILLDGEGWRGLWMPLNAEMMDELPTETLESRLAALAAA